MELHNKLLGYSLKNEMRRHQIYVLPQYIYLSVLWWPTYFPYTAFSIVCLKQNLECVGVRELWCISCNRKCRALETPVLLRCFLSLWFPPQSIQRSYSPLSGQRQHMRNVRKYRSNKYNESVWIMKQLRLIPSKGSLGEWAVFWLTVSSFVCSVKTFATAHP